MSDPQVSFQYEPTKQDRIMGRPNANGFRGLSPFLAVMPPSSYLVHGNSEILISGSEQKECCLALRHITVYANLDARLRTRVYPNRPDLQLEPRYARQRSELARYPRSQARQSRGMAGRA